MIHTRDQDNNVLKELLSQKLLWWVVFDIGISGAFNSVVTMILECYRSILLENNIILIVGYNQIEFSFLKVLREIFPTRKIYVYQLEQLYWYNYNCFDFGSSKGIVMNTTIRIDNRLNHADAIWWYDLDNIGFLQSLWYQAPSWIPMLHAHTLQREKLDSDKDIDVLFYWSLNFARIKALHYLIHELNIKVQIIGKPFSGGINEEAKKLLVDLEPYRIDSIYTEDIWTYIARSKIILNLHFYESHLQEQVRLFELLINNKCIVSQKSRRNYYGSLIYEFEWYEEMVTMIDQILTSWKRQNTKHLSWDFENISTTFVKEGKRIVDWITMYW